MEQTQTVQQVITSVVQTVAIIAPLAALGTFGLTEFAKKSGLPGKWAGIFAYVLGFVISVLVMRLTGNTWFSPLSILVGVIVALGTPGAYSGVSAALTPKDSTV